MSALCFTFNLIINLWSKMLPKMNLKCSSHLAHSVIKMISFMWTSVLKNVTALPPFPCFKLLTPSHPWLPPFKVGKFCQNSKGHLYYIGCCNLQLLDEMIDNGFPLTTEANILREMIAPPNIVSKMLSVVTGNSSNVSTTLPSADSILCSMEDNRPETYK